MKVERTGDWMRRDERESHLAALMGAACSDPRAGAQLADLADEAEGTIWIDMSFRGCHPIAEVNEKLSLAEMEATILHEAGHWVLGHIKGLPREGNYQGAVLADVANRTTTRGPWEQQANARATKFLGNAGVCAVAQSPSTELQRLLNHDARKYAQLEIVRCEACHGLISQEDLATVGRAQRSVDGSYEPYGPLLVTHANHWPPSSAVAPLDQSAEGTLEDLVRDFGLVR
jgi:hypothetical protein